MKYFVLVKYPCGLTIQKSIKTGIFEDVHVKNDSTDLNARICPMHGKNCRR
jgi:hypothetical protein